MYFKHGHSYILQHAYSLFPQNRSLVVYSKIVRNILKDSQSRSSFVSLGTFIYQHLFARNYIRMKGVGHIWFRFTQLKILYFLRYQTTASIFSF